MTDDISKENRLGDKRTKDLALTMSWEKAQKYVDDHPKWRMPTFEEALLMESMHGHFWVSDIKEGEEESHCHMCIDKDKDTLWSCNKSFAQPVALIDSGIRMKSRVEIEVTDYDAEMFHELRHGNSNSFTWTYPDQWGNDIDIVFHHKEDHNG